MGSRNRILMACAGRPLLLSTAFCEKDDDSINMRLLPILVTQLFRRETPVVVVSSSSPTCTEVSLAKWKYLYICQNSNHNISLYRYVPIYYFTFQELSKTFHRLITGVGSFNFFIYIIMPSRVCRPASHSWSRSWSWTKAPGPSTFSPSIAISASTAPVAIWSRPCESI